MNSERATRQAVRGAPRTRQPTVLAGKVRRLAVPAGAAPRPRLLPSTEALRDTRLFLLKAMAGYGKTTLLRQYAALAEQLGFRTAWLRFDASDNDPMKAVAYLIAAFAELDPTIGAELGVFLSAVPPPPVNDIVAELLGQLADRDDELILLIDDYDTIADPRVHDVIFYFLRNLPPNVRAVIASRRMPPWDLGAIEDAGGVRIVDDAQIRFEVEEAAAYLESVPDLTLRPGDAEAVHAQTQGWISAIKLVSHALSRGGARLDASRMDASAQRGLISYLASAVFDRLDGETQDFLLHTAPLERFCASLCDAVSGANTARSMIERLMTANLFIEPLDAVGHWFRYHSLFAEFLNDRLAQQSAIDPKTIHRRASFWFEVNRQPHAAAAHAMASGDALRQEALIEAAILDLVRTSQVSLAMNWFNSLPPGFADTKPDVLIPLAWCNIYLQRAADAQDLLARAKRVLRDESERLSVQDFSRRDEFLLELEIAELEIQRVSKGTLPDGRRLQAMRDRLSPGWNFLRAYVELLYCHLYVSQDLLEPAFAAASEAVVYANRVPNLSLANIAQEQQAQIRFLQGRLDEARALCEDAIERAYGPAGDPLPVVAHFHLLLAKLRFEANDLEISREHLGAARRLTPPLLGSPEILSEIEILDAQHRAAAGAPSSAIAALTAFNNCQLDRSAPHAIALVRAQQAWLHTSAEQLRAAEAILQQTGLLTGRFSPPPTLTIHPAEEFPHLAVCRYLIAAGKPEVAVNWLRSLLRLAERSGRIRSLIALNGLLALAQAQRNQPDSALRHVREMLNLGEQGGFARTILELTPDITPLLRAYDDRLAESGRPRSEYVRKLIEISWGGSRVMLAPAAQGGRVAPDAPASSADTVEALTRREAQILEMISVGRRNQEVADELLIAESSVRWHVRNLYAKLGVHNRTEASAKGRSLKLIR